ncbi:MAG: hypothetical protein ACRCSE_01770 [Vibrio sp.]
MENAAKEIFDALADSVMRARGRLPGNQDALDITQHCESLTYNYLLDQIEVVSPSPVLKDMIFDLFSSQLAEGVGVCIKSTQSAA